MVLSINPQGSCIFIKCLIKDTYYDKFKKSFYQEAILRNLSNRTREAYWWHIEDYRKFHGKDPENTGTEELRTYFQSMLTDGNHKPGSVKMGYYALRFLFVNVYHKEWAKEYLPTPKIAKTLPLVLSREEVSDVLSVIKNFKHRTVIMFIYSTGTRISECVNIKLSDIDSKRMQELLPVGYYHFVFTVPHQLNQLIGQNKKQVYDILFKAASQTVLELSRDTKHLGAETGLITVLHTWGQNMREHPHLHCIMPAGGLSFDKTHWVHNTLYKKQWVVNIQKPFAHAEKVLEYLSRYVFRIAISDRRIVKVENGVVHFMVKDYSRNGIFRKQKLDIDEFIRRFLLHILPEGFFKVRYYGIFANTCRKNNIARVKQLKSFKSPYMGSLFINGLVQQDLKHN